LSVVTPIFRIKRNIRLSPNCMALKPRIGMKWFWPN
jgi:hypothetical protein